MVIFDDSIKIVHYRFGIKNKVKGIGFENSRNILHGDFYEILKAKDTKHDVEYRYLYKFNEEDYLKAKNK